MVTGSETMDIEPPKNTEIALNVTRTRITVLVFNLTIIALMLSITSARSGATNLNASGHLTSSVALFVGFSLTLFGLLWLLSSQNLDAQGMSRPWPFTLGAITTYLALSQTVTAFMHEYLVKVKSTLEASGAIDQEKIQTLVRLDVLDDTALLILFVMGGGVWVLTTYVAPLSTVFRSPIRGGWRWVLAGYYFAIQVPIYWVYATTWQLDYVPADQDMNMLSLFALQFIQPVLWFH
jgi:hypothetical protein